MCVTIWAMKVISDLEIHSKYARAVSPQMTIPIIAEWAKKKGIDLIGTGDFTHPLWFREIKQYLEEAGEGVYKLKGSDLKIRFLLTSEISCIYTHKGKGRRVHIFVYLPDFSDVEKFNSQLTSMGANLFSDGRPIVGLTLSQIVETALWVNPKAIIIPAHVWTPWFGFYGQNSGYESLEEAFGSLAKYIPAVETGLSSDPAMNWRIAELTGRSIVSFSDAHSPPKLGREVTVFDLSKIAYGNIYSSLVAPSNKEKISYTIEFYPEEGKYHYTGHRKCGVIYSPNEARKMGLICPVCKKPLTIGVMGRVEHLATVNIETKSEKDKYGVRWIKEKNSQRPGYVMMVPLLEILAEAYGVGVGTRKVTDNYELITNNCGSEFKVLLETPVEEIKKFLGEKVAEAIAKVRSGDIHIEPGYDGVFGKVSIWPNQEALKKESTTSQTSLF